MAAMVRGVKRMDPRTTAVLVCDVQERFREVILGFDALCKCSAFVIKVADKLDIPVVVTEQYPKAFGATVAELKSVLPADQQYFDKTMFSMCTESVRAELTRLGTKSAILCGLETHVCVYQTTLDLLEMGIDVHVCTDAVSSQRHFDRSCALTNLAASGAAVTTSESLVFQLLGNSKHPKFKAIAPFVRENAEDAKNSDLQRL